jgi:osmotically-inducible protein OsmY
VTRGAVVRLPLRVAAVAAFAATLAGGGWSATPSPSPGPAARVGKALDNAWSTVQVQVGDALLLTRVRIALLEHLGSDGLRVQIDTKGGFVELSGQVEKRSSKDLARRVAGSVTGVREVHSTITVAPGGEAGPPVARVVGQVERQVADALLEGKVKARLLEELGRVAFDVEVHATDGVVSLSGTVPDAAREELAVRVARSTKGVKELHDLLKVKP